MRQLLGPDVNPRRLREFKALVVEDDSSVGLPDVDPLVLDVPRVSEVQASAASAASSSSPAASPPATAANPPGPAAASPTATAAALDYQKQGLTTD